MFDKTVIGILGGLGGMLGWGTSDFLANSAADKLGHLKTFFWSQVAGLLLLTALSLFYFPSFTFNPWQIMLLIAAGVAYALGYLLFYTGFEIGNVSVVSAVINLQTLFIIFLAYFIHGQSLTFWQIPAIFLLIIGVSLVSINFNDFKKGQLNLTRGVKETLLATVMFGVFFWPLNEYLVENSHWLPMSLLIKVIALATVALLSSWQKKELLITNVKQPKLLALVAAVGILEAFAVMSVNVGVAVGDGILVLPISSALSIVTVGLAVIFLKERLTRQQISGIVFTLCGILLSAF